MSQPLKSLAPALIRVFEFDYIPPLLPWDDSSSTDSSDTPEDGPIIALYLEDMTPIEYGDVIELLPGEHVLIIQNIGYGVLVIGEIFQQMDWEIVQPEENNLTHGQQTTLTVIVPGTPPM